MSTAAQRAWTHILQVPAETLRDLLLCMEAFTRHDPWRPASHPALNCIHVEGLVFTATSGTTACRVGLKESKHHRPGEGQMLIHQKQARSIAKRIKQARREHSDVNLRTERLLVSASAGSIASERLDIIAFTEEHAALLEAYPLDGVKQTFAGDVTHGSAHMSPSLLGGALRAVSRLADSVSIITGEGHAPTRFTGRDLHAGIAWVEVAAMPMRALTPCALLEAAR